jgi:hypothetical protein
MVCENFFSAVLIDAVSWNSRDLISSCQSDLYRNLIRLSVVGSLGRESLTVQNQSQQHAKEDADPPLGRQCEV